MANTRGLRKSQPGSSKRRDPSFTSARKWLLAVILLGAAWLSTLIVVDSSVLKVLATSTLHVEDDFVSDDFCVRQDARDLSCLVVVDRASLSPGAVVVGTPAQESTLAAIAVIEKDGLARIVGLPAGPLALSHTSSGRYLLASAIRWAGGPLVEESRHALLLVDPTSSQSNVEAITHAIQQALGPPWEITVAVSEPSTPTPGEFDVILVDSLSRSSDLPGDLDFAAVPVVTWSEEGWIQSDLAMDTTVRHSISDISGSTVKIEEPDHPLVAGRYGRQAIGSADDATNTGLVGVLVVSVIFGLVSIAAFTRDLRFRERKVAVKSLPSTLGFSYQYENQRREAWSRAMRWLALDFTLAMAIAAILAIRVVHLGSRSGPAASLDLIGGLAWVSFGHLVVIVVSAWFSYVNLKSLRRLIETAKANESGESRLDTSNFWAGTDDVGVCLSGGGIRAAAFGLGGLQALQEEPLWNDVRRLTAVSGGSYTAASYMLLMAKNGGSPYSLDSAELRRLRNNTHYLAPGAHGVFRAFTEWFTGLAWNLALVSSLIWLLSYISALIVKSQAHLPQLSFLAEGPAAPVSLISWSPDTPATLYAFAILGLLAIVHMFLSRLPARVVSWVREDWRPSEDVWKETNQRIVQGHLMALATLVLILAIVPRAVQLGAALSDLVAAAPSIAAGIASLTAVGWVAAILKGLAAGRGVQVAQRFAGLILPLAALAFFVWAAWLNVTLPTDTALIWVGMAVVWTLVSWAMPARRVSLHPFYRDRLIEGFASYEGGDIDRSLTKLPERPDLYVGAVANIGPGPVTPPGRSALPWVFSREFTGLESDGSQEPMLASTEAVDRKVRDEDAEGAYALSVMTAVAISGAAISPSMGRRTVRSFRSLLAVLNLRLGVWLPNPLFYDIWDGSSGESEESDGPRKSDLSAEFERTPRHLPCLLKETFGVHRPDAAHLYVTDGGHYDNLGLVSLLRQRCRTVICLDASADGSQGFETIAEAMMLAQAELGIEIDLDPERDGLWPESDASGNDTASRSVVSCRIDWEDGIAGRLIYCRASMTKDTGWSIDSYRRRDPTFPNTSTLKQLYGDETFEAYRSLGYEVGKRASKEYMANQLSTLVTP